MIDLEIVKEPICHALGKNEVQPESSIYQAYKIDSGKKIGSNITVNEGLCSLVGFSPSDFKQADYFLLDFILSSVIYNNIKLSFFVKASCIRDIFKSFSLMLANAFSIF